MSEMWGLQGKDLRTWRWTGKGSFNYRAGTAAYKAEAARDKKFKNIEEAKQNNGTKAVLSFDLQKT